MALCAKCHAREATHLCGHCRVAPYCSVACAAADWPLHLKYEHSSWHSDALSLVLSSGRGDLWVGGIEALQHLDEHHIGAVVTILQKERVLEDEITSLVGKRPHLRFYLYDDEDEPIEQFFKESTRFIDRHIRAGRNVLVHCHAGISRSVTLAIHYMMTMRGFETPQVALAQIRRARARANPNPGFMRALEQSNV